VRSDLVATCAAGAAACALFVCGMATTIKEQGSMKRSGGGGFWVSVVLGFGVALGLFVPTDASAKPSDVDIFRSLVVTEQPILARFSFQRVMDQLVAQSGVPGLTPLALFHQWWDTQNPAAEGVGSGIHCDSDVAFGGGPGINAYPYLCRPASAAHEGGEASSNPFINPGTNPGEYIPIGLFNRFDLAPVNGANCGEHRIVYARRSGITDARNRNLIIFEATMPNPHLDQGLKGCDKIVRFWADLSRTSDLGKRADDLEHFYFDGIAGLPPVVEISHYGDNATGVGQIRTNQFMQPAPTNPLVWNLREFKLIRTCAGASCSAMNVVPVTDKTNPFGPLFSAAGTHPQRPAFQTSFVTQVGPLAASALAGIDMKTPDVFNGPQSLASGSAENNYLAQFAGPSALRTDVQTALTGLGSGLSPDDIVKRARALSCAGCHRLSGNNPVPADNEIGGGLTWPASLGFTHVSEQVTTVGSDGVTRFALSPALLDAFLPVRKTVLDDFIDDKPPNANKGPDDPIGGRRVH
jgi:hypothetical protein